MNQETLSMIQSLDDNLLETLAEALAIAEDDFNFDGEYQKAKACSYLATLLTVKAVKK